MCVGLMGVCDIFVLGVGQGEGELGGGARRRGRVFFFSSLMD